MFAESKQLIKNYYLIDISLSLVPERSLTFNRLCFIMLKESLYIENYHVILVKKIDNNNNYNEYFKIHFGFIKNKQTDLSALPKVSYSVFKK